MASYVERLGAYASSMRYDGLPEPVVERARSCLLYNLAMAIAAARDDRVDTAIGRIMASAGPSRVLATGERRLPQDAAFANASLITARGQNDTLLAAGGHLGCLVVPAVLALAEQRKATLGAVISAMVAGYEVQAKVAKGGARAASQRGFRGTSTFGVFGAAAGAAHMLGLDTTQTAHALAIASNFAGGTMQCWADGTMEWRLQIGEASRAGVLAALFAANGIVGAPGALEGADGFYRAFTGDVPGLDLEGWSILQVVFKPYPGCAINQGPVHALLSLVARETLRACDVAGVEVVLCPSQATYPGVDGRGPFATPSGAVMSLAFMMTMALRDGRLVQQHFSSEYGNEEIARLGRSVTLGTDARLQPGESRVIVRLRDGRVLQETQRDAASFLFDWSGTLGLVRVIQDEVAGARADRIGAVMRRLSSFDERTLAEQLIADCVGAT